jgi:hypothetical protein
MRPTRPARSPIAAYFSRVVSGLVVCAVVAASLHADVAAVAVLGAVLLVVLAMSLVLLRDGHP